MEKELVEYIAKNLVDHPEEVKVECTGDEKLVDLRLNVAESDLGKVIGRQGRVARAIRTLLSASGTYSGRRVTLEIAD